MNPQDIKQSVVAVTFEVNMHWPNIEFPIPAIAFDIQGCNAGRATYSKHLVSFNQVLARENPETFNNTVIHEIAHLVCKKVYPWVNAHSREFYGIMAKLGGNPSRCHSYDVSSVKRSKTVVRYEAKCACQSHWLTSNLARKVKMGSRHFCRKCKSGLTVTGASKVK